MPITLFLQKFGRDIVYLSIIGGMIGWSNVEGKRQEAWNDVLMQDLKNATALADYTLERSKAALQKGARDYPSPQAEDYYRRALKSQRLLQY